MQIIQQTNPQLKAILKNKKYFIEDSLTTELMKSLITKVFYTLYSTGLLETCPGPIDIDDLTITPYRSVTGDVRYIVSFNTLYRVILHVFWNGKFDIKERGGKAKFFTSFPYNASEDLDRFVNFEKRVIEKLQKIQDEFFKVQQMHNTEEPSE